MGSVLSPPDIAEVEAEAELGSSYVRVSTDGPATWLEDGEGSSGAGVGTKLVPWTMGSSYSLYPLTHPNSKSGC